MTPSGVIVTISPGAISRTKAAPTTSSAGDSEATIHPSGASSVPEAAQAQRTKAEGVAHRVDDAGFEHDEREAPSVTRRSTAPSALASVDAAVDLAAEQLGHEVRVRRAST